MRGTSGLMRGAVTPWSDSQSAHIPLLPLVPPRACLFVREPVPTALAGEKSDDVSGGASDTVAVEVEARVLAVCDRSCPGGATSVA